MSAVEVRAAVDADVPRLARLGSEVFFTTYGDTARPDDIEPHVERHFSETAIRREMARAGVEYLMAQVDGECAGFVKLVASDLPSLLPATTALEVQQVYVATARQRGGIGRRLMDAAVTRARTRGVAGVWLSVWSKADWATRFYEQYGFRALGHVPFVIGRTEYDDYLMWLGIDNP